MLWTKNWTQQYCVFGDPPSQRSAEDIAYSVARFFSKNDTLNNYYMYYGGTDFGRTSYTCVTTRYYDEARLDHEYGLYKEPKFGHLRDLHFALKLNKKALLSGASSVPNLGKTFEINACNGRNGGDTFDKLDSPNKPMLWTENWTQQYHVFGDPPSQRSAKYIAYSIARFFSKNVTLNNYYTYYGGTDFGRTSSAFVTTRYYDEAPLDEYGLYKEPKFGSLRELHFALKQNKKALLSGASSVQNLGKTFEWGYIL